jgi:hypothetical protein
MPRMPTTIERGVLERAAAALADDDRLLDADTLAGDPPDPAALVAALRDRAGEGSVIVCAGVLARLPDFLGVVEALVALARERDATVVLAVPNDAFADGDGPDRTAWGEGAVAELRGLLPADHVAFHLLSLRGAALVPAGEPAHVAITVEADARATVPAAFVLAFGARASRLAATATVAAADLSAERAYDRARTAELEVLRARVGALDPRPELAPADGGQR